MTTKKGALAALFVIGAYWPVSVFLNFSQLPGRDFGSLWVGGHAIRAGINPYDFDAFKALGDQILGVAYYNFTYPPHALFLFAPFSYLPVLPSFLLWNVLGAAFFWWAARPWIPKGMPTVLAIVTPAALINFNFGQTGMICSALFLLAFRGNGLAAAALTLKPHFGFLVAFALLRNRRALLVAILGTVGLVLASALVFGRWDDFIAHARDFQGQHLASLSQPLWFIYGISPGIGYGLWGLVPFALGAAYFLSRNFNVFTAATATFLISPYGLNYDMPAACLGFLVVLYSRWDDMPLIDKVGASLAFLTPVIVVYATTWVIPPILLWGLVIQTRWTEGLRLQIKSGEQGLRKLKFERTPAVVG